MRFKSHIDEAAPKSAKGEVERALTDLKTTAADTLFLRNKHLTSLKMLATPKIVHAVQADHNLLKDLEGSPQAVNGSFSVDHNKLISLKGCPKKVGSYFSVSDNSSLSSLEGGPEEVGTAYYCGNTSIKNFKGIGTIGSSLYASNCKLTSLEGLSMKFLQELDVSGNQLTSLIGCPTQDITELDASSNLLTSLEGVPQRIGTLNVAQNKGLVSLEGIGHKFLKVCERIDVTGCKIKTNALGLLMISGLDQIDGDFEGLEIIQKHLGTGQSGLIDAQHELIEAGLEDLAEL